jgi:hypothetical protein
MMDRVQKLNNAMGNIPSSEFLILGSTAKFKKIIFII